MEFIYINSKSIKIIINGNEMYDRSIKADELDYANSKTKRFFWELMDRAYDEIGFDSQNSKLLVRIFPMNDGGCEIFVTKSEIKIAETAENNGYIVVTCDIDKIYMLCDRIKVSGLSGDSMLYCDDNDSFYLVLYSKIRLPSYVSDRYTERYNEYAFASEYGEVYNLTDDRITYLNEHMELICDRDAVERLSK